MGESGKVKWVDERKVFVRSLATKLNQKALSKRAPRRATGELIALEKVVPVVPSECVCVRALVRTTLRFSLAECLQSAGQIKLQKRSCYKKYKKWR